MENFIVVLLIVGSVVYKIYSEYQKEQEKARRRMPSVPAPQSIPPRPLPVDHQPKSDSPTPNIPSIPYEQNPTKTFEEVGKKRKNEEKIQQKPLLNEVILKVDQEHEEGAFHFDLREAVIQSAILNRKY